MTKDSCDQIKLAVIHNEGAVSNKERQISLLASGEYKTYHNLIPTTAKTIATLSDDICEIRKATAILRLKMT